MSHGVIGADDALMAEALQQYEDLQDLQQAEEALEGVSYS
jgi:hypothetical protein